MTKIPLGVVLYPNIPNFTFIILTKTIGTGINRIGQANLKNNIFHYSSDTGRVKMTVVVSRVWADPFPKHKISQFCSKSLNLLKRLLAILLEVHRHP